MKHWSPVKPNRVRRSFRDHPWLFAYYFEASDERDDGTWYHALMFRDRDWSTFGAAEWTAPGLTVPDFEKQHDVRAIASRIITDESFRQSLIRDSKLFRDLWSRQ